MTFLQQWMEREGLKDHQVAAQVGLSRAQVSRIRRGLVGSSTRTTKRLAQLTGLSLHEFMRRSGQLDDTSQAAKSRHRQSAGARRDQTREQASARSSKAKFDRRASRAPRPDLSEEPSSERLTSAIDRLSAAVERLSECLEPVGSKQPGHPRRRSREQDSSDLMSVRDVCSFFGGTETPLDPSTIYRWVRRGVLPKPIKVGTGTLSRWKRSDCKVALCAMGDAH